MNDIYHKSDTHQLPLWAHTACVFLGLILTVLFGVAIAICIYDLIGGQWRLVSRDGVLLASFGLPWMVLFVFWRRYWFLPAHLKKVLRKKGRLQLQTRYGLRAIWFQGAVAEFRLLGRLTYPIGDFRPILEWDRTANPPQKRVIPFPESQIDGSRIAFFRIGDFSDITARRLKINASGAVAVEGVGGDDAFGRALRDIARDTLQGADVDLEVEVNAEWLQVEIRGGVWLGGSFGDRIGRAYDFAVRLVESLQAGRVLRSPGSWTIDWNFQGNGFLKPRLENFIVSPIRSDAPTNFLYLMIV